MLLLLRPDSGMVCGLLVRRTYRDLAITTRAYLRLSVAVYSAFTLVPASCTIHSAVIKWHLVVELSAQSRVDRLCSPCSGCVAVLRRTKFRHDVTGAGFRQAGGPVAATAAARAADRHARSGRAGARPRLSGSRARRCRARTQPTCGSPTSSTCTRAKCACRIRASSTRGCRCHPTSRSRRSSEARAHLAGPRLPEKTDLFWNQGLIDVLFEYPIQSAAIRILHPAAAGQARVARRDRAALPAARTAPSAHSNSTATPASCAGSPLASGRAAFRRIRLHAHSRRHRSPAVPVLPRHSVPPLRPLVLDGHVVHRRAFDHADRVGLRPRPRCAMVSAADRNADRSIDRLHGHREHHRRQCAAGAG